MKTILTLAALLIGTAAHAGPFGLPDHEQRGYRDTGCDPAKQVDMGGYSNNPTCNGGNSGNGAAQLAALRELIEAAQGNGGN